MSTSPLLARVVADLRRLSFDTSSEARLQAALEEILAPLGFSSEVYTREGRIDFLHAEGLAIEVKIDGTNNDLRRQVLRYLNLPEVVDVLVITTQARHRGAAELFRVHVFDLNTGRLYAPPKEPAAA